MRGELGTCISVQITLPLCVSLIYVEHLVLIRNLCETAKEIIDF